MKFVILALSLLALGALGAPPNMMTAMNLFAEMNGASEIPAVTTAMTGTAALYLDPTSGRLHYWAAWMGGAGTVTGFHLHFVDNSPKIYLALSGVGVTQPLAMDVREKVLAGLSYLNVHTTSFTAGEIRGAVRLPAATDQIYSSVCTAAQETFQPAAASASALAVGIVRYNPMTLTAAVNAVWNAATGSVGAVHVHQNTTGLEGTRICNFGTSGQGNCTVIDSLFTTNAYYLNFHGPSPPSPGPALVRGQIIRINGAVAPSTATFTANMTFGTFSGLALLGYDGTGMALTYAVWHSAGAALTSVSLGSAQYSICSTAAACASPIRGTLIPSQTSGGLFSLLQTLLSTITQPMITLSGSFGTSMVPVYYSKNTGAGVQVSKYVTYMDTLQELPSSGSTSTGNALLMVDAGASMLHYSMWWVPTATALTGLHVHYGANYGTNASLRLTLTIPSTSTAGYAIGSFPIPAATLGNFTTTGLDVLNGRAYVNIHTSAHTVGEIRGYTKVVDAITPPQPTLVATLAGASSQTGLAAMMVNPVTRQCSLALTTSGLDAGDSSAMARLLIGTTLVTSIAPGTISGDFDCPTVPSTTYTVTVVTANFPNGAMTGTLTAPASTYAAVGQAWPEVLPNVIPSNLVAIAFGTFDTSTNQVSFRYGSQNPTNPPSVTALHLHVGAAAGFAAGGPYVACATTGTACNGVLQVTTIATMVPLGTVVAAQARIANAYLNVHTSLYTTGEARGQLGPLTPLGLAYANTPDWQISSVLNGANQIPAVTTVATGVALFSYDATTRVLSYHIVHNVVGATVAHIHLGNVTSSGAPLFDFGSVASPMIGSFTLDEGIAGTKSVCELAAARWYVNIHSSTFPSGEIRGQIDPAATGAYFGTLAGTAVNPTTASTASGVYYIDAANNAQIWHSLVPANVAKVAITTSLGVGADMAFSTVAAMPVTLALSNAPTGARVYIQTGEYPSGEIGSTIVARMAVNLDPNGLCAPNVTTTTGAPTTATKKSNKLSGGAVAGIVIVVVVVVVAAIVGVLLVLKKMAGGAAKGVKAGAKSAADGGKALSTELVKV